MGPCVSGAVPLPHQLCHYGLPALRLAAPGLQFQGQMVTTPGNAIVLTLSATRGHLRAPKSAAQPVQGTGSFCTGAAWGTGPGSSKAVCVGPAGVWEGAGREDSRRMERSRANWPVLTAAGQVSEGARIL